MEELKKKKNGKMNHPYRLYSLLHTIFGMNMAASMENVCKGWSVFISMKVIREYDVSAQIQRGE